MHNIFFVLVIIFMIIVILHHFNCHCYHFCLRNHGHRQHTCNSHDRGHSHGHYSVIIYRKHLDWQRSLNQIFLEQKTHRTSFEVPKIFLPNRQMLVNGSERWGALKVSSQKKRTKYTFLSFEIPSTLPSPIRRIAVSD